MCTWLPRDLQCHASTISYGTSPAHRSCTIAAVGHSKQLPVGCRCDGAVGAAKAGKLIGNVARGKFTHYYSTVEEISSRSTQELSQQFMRKWLCNLMLTVFRCNRISSVQYVQYVNSAKYFGVMLQSYKQFRVDLQYVKFRFCKSFNSIFHRAGRVRNELVTCIWCQHTANRICYMSLRALTCLLYRNKKFATYLAVCCIACSQCFWVEW